MLNQFILVGRLKECNIEEQTIKVEITQSNDMDKKINVEIILEGNLLEATNEYCKEGDIVGIKGHMIENQKIKADKITILSSKSGK